MFVCYLAGLDRWTVGRARLSSAGALYYALFY